MHVCSQQKDFVVLLSFPVPCLFLAPLEHTERQRCDGPVHKTFQNMDRQKNLMQFFFFWQIEVSANLILGEFGSL